MYEIELFNFIISILFLVCYTYQVFYCIVPFIKRKKKNESAPIKKYAVLIAARNEENVIGNLIDSLHEQDYPSDMLDIFVIADNCTDNTAQIAEQAGAIVYQRHNKTFVGKGYALEFLINQITAEYTVDYYDGYFVFDADNVMEPNYITEMNKTFCDGNDIVTCYRNSKNYGANWISAGYALWFIRESEYLNHARYLLDNSACVGGTGFMFSKKIVIEQNGWHYHLLTEDVEFSAASIAKGYKIAYCTDAVIYDEQPTTFSQSWSQRMRWRKGYFQVVINYGKDLIRGTAKGSFSCYDMLANIAPRAVLSTCCIAANLAYTIALVANGIPVLPAVVSFLQTIFGGYQTLFLMGLFTTITQWKNIKCSSFKKILYTFTFPIFMFTYLPISVIALFTKVSWRPIKHTDTKKISDIKNEA